VPLSRGTCRSPASGVASDQVQREHGQSVVLAPQTDALVLTVWEPLQAVPFLGGPLPLVPEEVVDGIVERAREVAKEGTELARAAGFTAEPLRPVMIARMASA
jgi:hypothetical protein